MTSLLTEQERDTLTDLEWLIKRVGEQPAQDYRSGLMSAVTLIKALRQRGDVAIVQERYKWRNFLVDVIEEYEHGNGQFDTPQAALKHIYERLASEQDAP